MPFYELYSEVTRCYSHHNLLVKIVTCPSQNLGEGSETSSLDEGVVLSHCRKTCKIEAFVVVSVGNYSLLHFCLFLRVAVF